SRATRGTAMEATAPPVPQGAQMAAAERSHERLRAVGAGHRGYRRGLRLTLPKPGFHGPPSLRAHQEDTRRLDDSWLAPAKWLRFAAVAVGAEDDRSWGSPGQE